MNQSSIIAATLLAGFVLYLAARGRLKVYADVLWGNTSAPLPSNSAAIPGFAGGASGGSGMVPELPGLGGSGGFLESAPGALLKSAPELLLLAP